MTILKSMTFSGTYTLKANYRRGEVIKLTHTPGSFSKKGFGSWPRFLLKNK